MKKEKQLQTAEYVSPKHPDKMCDAISDAILNSFLDKDKDSRVAVETLGGHGKIFIMGEVTSKGNLTDLDYKNIVKRITVKEDYDISIYITKQSLEISRGVDSGGAGDQGIVIGYACDENEEMLPHEYYLAKSLCNFIYKKSPYDGKTQVTINENFEIIDIVASFQNTKTEILRNTIYEWKEKNDFIFSKDINFFINPSGEWSNGGFDSDTGLTGRKIVVDSYGPRVPVGGGAFSGKDWTKVDRSGALYARYIAKKILKKEKAHEVLVKLAYAIGVKEAIQSIVYIDNIPRDIVEFDTSMDGIKKFIRKDI